MACPEQKPLPLAFRISDLDVVVAVGVRECGVNLLDEFLVLGVGLLGPVERDFRYGALLFEDDPFACLC